MESFWQGQWRDWKAGMGKDMEARKEKKVRNGWVGGMGHHTRKLSIWVSNSLGEEARTRRMGRRAAGASAENARICRRDLCQKLIWASKTVALLVPPQCCLCTAACMESWQSVTSCG